MSLIKINNRSSEDNAIHGRRNLIINGSCAISQRGTSFTNLGNGQYCLDRFHISKITGGAVDIKQTDDAPTTSQAGYLLTKCLHADVTTADTSVAASDMYTIRQSIEYKNIEHVGFGQSGTRYVTASFWVKSTKTGTFCCYIKSNPHTRAYTKEYTVSASDTWEYKKLTFPVDTSNSAEWNNNGSGGELGWTLYSGTDYHITADTWTTTSNNYAPCTSNQVNALDSASNDFKITGVQLELGDTATPLEHISFGEELARCERYYEKSYNYSYAPGTLTSNGAEFHQIDDGGLQRDMTKWRTKKRVAPSVTIYNTDTGTTGEVRTNANTNFSTTVYTASEGSCFLSYTPTSGQFLKYHYQADSEI